MAGNLATEWRNSEQASGKSPLAKLQRAQGPDLSREVTGSCFGAQGAASTHRSPQNSHSFSAVTSQDPGQSFWNSALYRPAAAAEQAEDGGREGPEDHSSRLSHAGSYGIYSNPTDLFRTG